MRFIFYVDCAGHTGRVTHDSTAQRRHCCVYALLQGGGLNLNRLAVPGHRLQGDGRGALHRLLQPAVQQSLGLPHPLRRARKQQPKERRGSGRPHRTLPAPLPAAAASPATVAGPAGGAMELGAAAGTAAATAAAAALLRAGDGAAAVALLADVGPPAARVAAASQASWYRGMQATAPARPSSRTLRTSRVQPEAALTCSAQTFPSGSGAAPSDGTLASPSSGSGVKTTS